MNENLNILKQDIKSRIYNIRGVRVMIDNDLADIYGVETRIFNQAVKRNQKRFPSEFRFQLTEEEYNDLKSQFVISSSHGGRRKLPFVFTEQGVAMLASVLRSDTAININIQIIKAFTEMRKFISGKGQLFNQENQLENRLLMFEDKTNNTFKQVFKEIENKNLEPEKGIFFDGQIFDAYIFISDLIKRANHSIYIIDNYVDDSVIHLLTKKKKNVKVTIFTKNISPSLKLDAQKFNQQYKNLDIKIFNKSHDRFIILDDDTVYHIGASLKDLGKSWFAFSKFEKETIKDLLNAIKKV
jgi:phage regulator Rha-like protein